MPIVLNHRSVRESLRPLPAYPALSAAIRNAVDAKSPKAGAAFEAERTEVCRQVEALYEPYAAFVAVRREVLRSEMWRDALAVMAGATPSTLLDTSDALTAAIFDAADALRESPIAVALALNVIGITPAINEEAF